MPLALQVQFAELMDLDRGPERHIVMLRAGAVGGVKEGPGPDRRAWGAGSGGRCPTPLERGRPHHRRAACRARPGGRTATGLRAIAYGTGRFGSSGSAISAGSGPARRRPPAHLGIGRRLPGRSRGGHGGRSRIRRAWRLPGRHRPPSRQLRTRHGSAVGPRGALAAGRETP